MKSDPGFSGESFLKTKLPREEFIVQSRIIEALGKCGSLTSVEVLYNLKNILLKSDAREAIILIQQRANLSGAKGQLSLTDSSTDHGKLALSENGFQGSVSLIDTKINLKAKYHVFSTEKSR